MFTMKTQDLKKISYVFLTISSISLSSQVSGMNFEEDEYTFQSPPSCDKGGKKNTKNLTLSKQVDSAYGSALFEEVNLTNYSKAIRKDVKNRKKMVYSYETQKMGEFLYKYVTPVLAKTSAILLLVPDPSGVTQITGASIAATATVTGAGGMLMKHSGKNIKEHYGRELQLDASILKVKEEKSLIDKERNFINAVKKRQKLQERIRKNEEKGQENTTFIRKKLIEERKILTLKQELENDPKLNYLNLTRSKFYF